MLQFVPVSRSKTLMKASGMGSLRMVLNGSSIMAVPEQPPSALLSALLNLLQQLPDADRARLAAAMQGGTTKGDA